MKIKIIIGLLFVTILNYSCSKESSGQYRLHYIPFENEDSDEEEYGLIDKDGIVFEKRFENIVGPVINGYFALREEDGLTLCKVEDGSYKKLTKAGEYFGIGIMNDGLIPVCKDEENIQVLDSDGDVRFTLDKVDNVDVWNCYSYSCGKMRVGLYNQKYVYVDTEGKNAFGKSYEWATDFDNGYAVVGVGEDKYELIKDDGEALFTFTCDDPEEIRFSAKYRKLSAKDENDSYSIYEFDGQSTPLPKMVEGIYALLENEFIFKSDYKYGLMNYGDCRDKIYAKYDQLVPNGRYYLGIPSDNDQVVKLLDSSGAELETFDGDEIYSPIQFGFEFPNIIKRPDDRTFLVDAKGRMIGRAENFSFDMDDIKDASMVHNMYFPSTQVDNKILSLCGDGKGVPSGEGAFFRNGDTYCRPHDINYFRNASNLDQFKGKDMSEQLIEEGVNYCIGLAYKFDEPIVRLTADSLNTSAWLQYIEIEMASSNIFAEVATYNRVAALLKENGCSELFSNNGRGIIFQSSNSENMLVLYQAGDIRFRIRMSQYSESLVEEWKKYLTDKK